MAEEHRVAWADRIGLNKQWARDVLACGESFGTPTYPVMVRRFRNNIINIKNGPQLRDTIDSFVREDLQEWKQNELLTWREHNTQKAKTDSYVRARINDIEYAAAEELYKYMVQLLENEGFCFYESVIEEDEMSQ